MNAVALQPPPAAASDEPAAPGGTRGGGSYTLAFLFAIGLHAALLFAVKTGVIEGPEFAVTAGETSVEVALVAAAPAAVETVVEAEPEVTPEPPPVQELVPEPPAVEPAAIVEPAPPPPVAPRVRETPRQPPAVKKPAPRRAAAVGDGSSATPGLDASTTSTGPVGDRAKPGYLRNPHPTYPEVARRSGQQGVVELRVRVNADGSAMSVALTRSSGFPLLDERAVSTVRDRGSFKPARAAGVAVASEVIIPIRFSLRD